MSSDLPSDVVFYTWWSIIRTFSMRWCLFSGHFTQVVWQKSTELGIAFATYKDGEWNKVVVVGNYYPAGNVTSQFEENVKQAKKDTKSTKNSSKKWAESWAQDISVYIHGKLPILQFTSSFINHFDCDKSVGNNYPFLKQNTNNSNKKLLCHCHADRTFSWKKRQWSLWEKGIYFNLCLSFWSVLMEIS